MLLKKNIIYKNKYIKIEAQEKVDMSNIYDIMMACIEAGLIGAKTMCLEAKEPLEVWKYIKEDMQKAIHTMENILSE